MQHLDLDFVRTTPRRPWLGGALLGCGATALLLVWQAGQHGEQDIAGLQLQLARANRAQQAEQAKPAPAEDPNALAAAFGLRRQWRIDWDGLYQALEQAQFKGIALLQLLPDARRGQLKLAGEALSEADLHDYLRRLQQTGRLREAVLAQSAVDEKQPHRPIRFQLQAEWVQR